MNHAVMDHAVMDHIMHVGCTNWKSVCYAGDHGQMLNHSAIAALGIIVNENGFAESGDVKRQSLD